MECRREKISYKSNEAKEEFRLGVLPPHGLVLKIEYLAVDVLKAIFGVWTFPAEDTTAQFLSILQKGQIWIELRVESHL